MGQLRFAPIIRVSTEKQEKEGESLKTQTAQIKSYVKSLNGIIPDSCWEYSGQEHATPELNRIKLDKLLSDASKGIFDAVIVCDVSRWSRDNLKSKEGLNVLRANGIKFFVSMVEYDLYNPTQNLFLGMSAEIGEFQATHQSLKSIQNRINRAKEGIPTGGKIPYGRTYDKKTGKWDTDKDKKLIMEQVATRYLAGEGIPVIAKTYNINAASLHKTLTKRCGSDWEITFKSKRLNIDETVIIEVPRLLSEKTIKKIHERVHENKTYTRGNHKFVYLLGRKVYCQRCGYSMASYRNHNHKTYYRHSKYGTCDFRRLIPAVELENSVLLLLVQTFGDPEKIQKAIERTTPDLKRIQSLEAEKILLEKELGTIKMQKTNIIKSTSLGTFSDADAQPLIFELNDRKEPIDRRLLFIKEELDYSEKVKNVSEMSASYLKKIGNLSVKIAINSTQQNPGLIFKRTDKWKRKLIEDAFTSVNLSGENLGVYVDYKEKKGVFSFEIRGAFESTLKTLPLTDDDLIDVFKLDLEYSDIEKELKYIRSNMLSKCHAYNSKCIY